MMRIAPRRHTVVAMEALQDRLTRTSAARLDALLAAALFLLAELEVWLAPGSAGQRPETGLAAAVVTVALAWRRRHPFAVATVVMSAVLALALTAGLPNVAFLLPVGLIAMYTLGAYAGRERGVAGLVITIVSLPLGAVRTDDATVTDLTAPVVLFVAAWSAGRVLRARRERADELEDRADRLEREQDARERQAAADERARIARELHDIVAHRVTTIVIQADSGSVTADDPGRAREAFGGIAASGRQALAELRRLLELMRAEDESAAIAPQPGLARIDELVRGARDSGMPVDTRLDGDLTGLPAGVDLTAYRIVQEALTNALRHARTRAHVVVSRDGDRLVLEVRNPLADGLSNGDGAGRGLAGMRERVRVYDGELTAAAVDGDWVVRATLPVAEADS
jgi:signal transduction histidine kinase